MFLLYLAAQKHIPATLSITADTGSENDRVCSTGERLTARQFFDSYVEPYAKKHSIEAVFVRSVDVNKNPLPALIDILRKSCGETFAEMTKGIAVPLFTKDRSAGRLRQSCTDKWKIRAIHQEARRRGVKTLRSAIGFHAGEVHRLKGKFLATEGSFDIYKPFVKRKGMLREVRWIEHYYPLINLGLNRQQIQGELKRAKLPYLITTECDHCPHQDYKRWSMHTPEVIEELSKIESKWNGKLFFTDQRIPLKLALQKMHQRHEKQQQQDESSEADFGCEKGAYCGI